MFATKKKKSQLHENNLHLNFGASQRLVDDNHVTEFSIFSKNATKVELCLFDEKGGDLKESRRVEMITESESEGEGGGGVSKWKADVANVNKNQLYGYRLEGPYEPQHGHWFNKNKLALDPYALALGRNIRWHKSLQAYQNAEANLSEYQKQNDDSALYAPMARLVERDFDWQGVVHPQVAWKDTNIYEVHVKGFSINNQAIAPELRGSYAGLASDASIEWFKKLGITAVELLPVHYHADDHFLTEKGLVNYWGYSTLAFFAPDERYKSANSACVVHEFKAMVQKLHSEGIEVILDVVYNHTCEHDHNGPSLSWRAIDNASYYHLDNGYCHDFTGCGNTLNSGSEVVQQMVLESLRYWHVEMQVDGFRFDLATSLARDNLNVDMGGHLMNSIINDPLLKSAKLIAEPWDLGSDGYQLGNFPEPFTEWNGRFRDNVRRFWNCGSENLNELADALAGSGAMFKSGNASSINFITCHDGFTLRDLVSYNVKHNEANKEDNRDGSEHNSSSNCGHEGETDDANILRFRLKQQKNFLATLFLSQGVPMICAGDELGRTRFGNNNGYCQDNEINYFDWSNINVQLSEFTQEVIALRKKMPENPELIWLRKDGEPFHAEDWQHCKSLLLIITSNAVDETQENNEILIAINGENESYHLPQNKKWFERNWVLELDSSKENNELLSDEHYLVADHSIAIFL